MKIRKHIPLLIALAAVLAIFAAYRLWKKAVTDVVPPQISVPAGVFEVSVNDPRTKLLEGITAHDDRQGDVTSSLMIEKIGTINEDYEFVVYYAAFDGAGNVSKTRRTVRYTDYESPKFYLNEPLLFSYGRDVDIVNRVSAFDLIDGDISHKIKPTVTSEIPVSSEGIHQILFRVTNSHGDTASITLPAEVYPTGRYNATLELSDYLVYIPVGQTFNPESYLRYFIYFDTTVRIGGVLPRDYKLTVDNTVNTQVPGIYTVTYTLYYEAKPNPYTAYTKLIVIVEG